MKLKSVTVDTVMPGAPSDAGGNVEFVVWIRAEMEPEYGHIGDNAKMVVGIPYDPDLTFAQISDAAIRKAILMLGAMAGPGVGEWQRLCAESLKPPVDWSASDGTIAETAPTVPA